MISRGVFEAKSITHEPAAGRFRASVSFQVRKCARRAQTQRLGMAGAALVPSPRHNEQAQWKSCRPLAISKQNPNRPDQVSSCAGLASPPLFCSRHLPKSEASAPLGKDFSDLTALVVKD